MHTPPQPDLALPTPSDPNAQTGSNVRDASDQGQSRSTRELRLLDRRAKTFRREGAKLFSKTERRAAAEIIARTRAEYLARALKQGADAQRWRRTRDDLRTDLERELSRALPNYRRWRQLQRAYQADRKRLLREHHRNIRDPRMHINLGEVAPPSSEHLQIFNAPFTLFDVGRWEGSMEYEDHSVAVPSLGHIVNNFEVEQTDDGPIPFDVFGLNWLGRFETWAKCGVNYTTPVDGRLRVGAGLQNFYSRVRFGAEDHFGFSEAELEIVVRLVIELRHSGGSVFLSHELAYDDFSSDGEDVAEQLPSFTSDGVYALEGTTSVRFAANTGLQILAGVEVGVRSETDDMRSYVDTLLWWQLKTLSVDVV